MLRFWHWCGCRFARPRFLRYKHVVYECSRTEHERRDCLPEPVVCVYDRFEALKYPSDLCKSTPWHVHYPAGINGFQIRTRQMTFVAMTLLFVWLFASFSSIRPESLEWFTVNSNISLMRKCNRSNKNGRNIINLLNECPRTIFFSFAWQ